MRYIKLIACRVMAREVSLIAAHCNSIVDVTWLPQGLHSTIGELARCVQREIDSLDAGNDPHTTAPPPGRDFDAIVLGYGLCSNGTAGLSSKRYPLVIPRAHDCITLFLGSKERYRELFDQNPGTYWSSAGWGELFDELADYQMRDSFIALYEDKYGREVAEEMADAMADMGDVMMAHYNQMAMINWPEFDDDLFMAGARQTARQTAADNSWQYREFAGDSDLLRSMLEGDWDNERFIVIPPGQKSAVTYDDNIFKCVEL